MVLEKNKTHFEKIVEMMMEMNNTVFQSIKNPLSLIKLER